MTITGRIKFTIAGLLSMMVIVGAVGLVTQLWIGSWSSGYDEALAQTQAAATLSEASSQMFISGAAAVSSQDASARAAYESVRWAKRAEATEALNTLAELDSEDVDGASALSTMQNAFDQCDQALTSALSLANTDQQQAVAAVSSEVQPLAFQLADMAGSYLVNEQTRQQAAVDALNGRVRAAMIALIAFLAADFVIGVALAALLTRRLRRQLGDAVSGISTSTAELLAIASQVAASAAQTAASTNETTATVEEVKQTAQLSHEKASQVAENSQNVARFAEAGRATTEDTVSGFELIQNQMGLISEAIDRLGAQTQTVSDIITTVNDLAEQSNLLSVNASIEAAKAGEQGKGFTVVAHEVKNLAEQSKQAVTHVRMILGEIQKASRLAVQAAEHGQEAIEAGRRKIEAAGEGTLALADSASEAAESAVQISASSRQQLAGMEQIGQAIESINQAGNQSVAGTRQVEQEVKQLQDLALSLKRMVHTKATA